MRGKLGRFWALLCLILLLTGCARSGSDAPDQSAPGTQALALDYATQFTVELCQDGCSLVTVAGRDRFLLVPRGTEADPDLARGAAVIETPVENLYLAASSAMDFFRALDALDRVTMTSTTAENWSLPEVRSAVERDEILYVGKYSAPDYEVVLDEGCQACVESTMIYHTPEVKEQLERLGIPVLVEHSSYESHPLGRLEWIKLYGLLTGRESEAEDYFRTQAEEFQRLSQGESTGKRTAFFYITPSGAANVRKNGDYVAKLIELAGGIYAFDALSTEENALSTVNLQMETFFAEAKDADVLIYNGTVDGGVDSLWDLLEKSALLEQFRAVREGNVWCSRQNLFQQPTGVCGLLEDFRTVLTGADQGQDELNYLRRVR